MLLDYYKKILNIDLSPKFLDKYLDISSLQRLKDVSYFCGMDYASKDIYDFGEFISRYDHSLTTALLTWRLTYNKIYTLAALFHDISTPCFSHVIDYMNKDYLYQETTEEFTEKILREDKKLIELLKKDNILIDSLINYKKYLVVDNERPKLCADRLDGIILTSISWTKNINEEDIKDIVLNASIYKNEYDEEEIGFNNRSNALLVYNLANKINEYCHSNEDNYMMELLANLTSKAILKGIITYYDLYYLTESEIFNKFILSGDEEILYDLNLFKTVKKDEIEYIHLPFIKNRNLNPLVRNKRLVVK